MNYEYRQQISLLFRTIDNMENLNLKSQLTSITSRANLLLTLKILVTASATLALFSKDLGLVFSDALQSEITSHILAVPFIFVYMLYRKRKTLRAVLPLDPASNFGRLSFWTHAVSLLLLTTAILTYWHGSYTFTPLEYHLLALPFFTAGLVLLLFNLETLRHLAFPIVFLFFLVPPPSEILYVVGALLSTLSAEISSTLASLFGIPTTLTSQYGNPLIQITRPDGTLIDFTIDVACSGIYGLVGFALFATLVAYLIRDKLWKKTALILIGIPIIYAFNVIRITIILVVGYHYGGTIALQLFHLLGGWVLTFIGTLLLLLISEKLLKTQIFAKTERCEQCSSAKKAGQSLCSLCNRLLKPEKTRIKNTDMLKMVVIVLVTASLVVIQTPVFALAQTPSVLVTTPAGQQISTDALPNITGYNLSYAFRDTTFERQWGIDMAIMYVYVPQDITRERIWVTIEISPIITKLHRWETCLISIPLEQGRTPNIQQIELRDIRLFEDPVVIGRYFAFNNTRQYYLQATLYWYETAIFDINSTMQQRYVKTSVISQPDSIDAMQRSEIQLTEVATSILEYWQPVKTWSPLTMLLAQNGGQLAAATSTLLLVTLLLYVLETRRQQQLNKSAYSKLSETDKQIIDSIRETEKTCTPALKNIHASYRETTGKSIDEKQYLQKLEELEKIGVVRKVIKSINDEPFQTWKT
jgi:exosortase